MFRRDISNSPGRLAHLLLGTGIFLTNSLGASPVAPPMPPEEEVQVLSVEIPELAWNTNAMTITVKNGDDRAHQIDIHVQYRNLSFSAGGVGWNTTHTVDAGEQKDIERDFMVKSMPGKVRVRLTVKDDTEDRILLRRDYTAEFPLANRRINPLTVPALVDAERREYPPLQIAEREHFVFYFVRGDSYAESRLESVASQREKVYRELARKLNPDFEGRVAFFLFPDADTKYAFTFHRGDGWAVGGKVIVEIFNPDKQLDPNHELVHVITSPLGNPPAMFNEGLAAYLQEGERWDGYTVDAWARAFHAEDLLFPLPVLFAFTDIGSEKTRGLISYPQAASVVKYLVETHGWEKFLEAFRELQGDDSQEGIQANRVIFRRIFGASVEEIESAWLKNLQSRNLEAIPPDVIREIKSQYPEAGSTQ